ncbi:MAG: endonuclease/exonuclease/phosphatase, partial [Armatimonadota bacterium]
FPTNISGTESSTNIAFDGRATVEYTGRFGIVDLMRQYRLTAAQAQQVAQHLPVWAEFSVYEGGAP